MIWLAAAWALAALVVGALGVSMFAQGFFVGAGAEAALAVWAIVMVAVRVKQWRARRAERRAP